MLIPKDNNRLIISKIYNDWDELQNKISSLNSEDDIYNIFLGLANIEPEKMIKYPRIGSYIKRSVNGEVYYYKVKHLMDGELYPCDSTAFAYVERFVITNSGSFILDEGYAAINITFNKYCEFDYVLTDEEKLKIRNKIDSFLN